MDEEARNPLPAKVLALRKRSFTVFVSNLSPRILKSELEAMFCRSYRIVDSFLLADKSLGQKRGFAFVRFGSREKAARAVEDGNDRSWGGRKIQVNLAKPEAERSSPSLLIGSSSRSRVVKTPSSLQRESTVLLLEASLNRSVLQT